MVIKGIRSDEILGIEEFSRLVLGLSSFWSTKKQPPGRWGNPGVSLPESHMQSFQKEGMMSCAQCVDRPSEVETEN